MLRHLLAAAFALLFLALPAHAQRVTVTLDVESARAVLAAVRDPGLTRERALAVARLPGSQGIIRKVATYGAPADEASFADALLAAAQRRPSELENAYRFAAVRDAADAIQPVLDALAGPGSTALDEVKARIALFTPVRVRGVVKGYLIVGGPSGGFAFGEPEFFLNLARWPSPLVAKTVLTHELFHGVMGLAAGMRPPSDAAKACLAAIPEAQSLGRLYGSLRDEGMASYVADMLALPADDVLVKPVRDRAVNGVNLVKRSVTLLGLSTHALTSGSDIPYGDIYALGFYDDEILYALGYVMVRAIAREAGEAAVADLIDQPGAALILRYAALKGYGGRGAPALDARTIDWAKRLAACG